MIDVSVIIPIYRPGPLVYEAIDSILAQAHAALEIIVVDDGSEDGTAESIEQRDIPNLRVLTQINAGPASARNRGLTFARGSVVAFLDADDLWLPGRLDLQLQILQSNPDADMVMGNTVGFGEETEDGHQRFRANWESQQLLQLGSVIVKREVFDSVGMFDPALRFAEDVDWFLRAREAGVTMIEHPDPVLKYRRHANNMTNDTESRDKGFIGALRKNLQRKRSGK
ncbi:MAG: glycosyltransferase family A protein [Pseudomonadales bacterium]